MDPIHLWLDPVEVRRLAEGLMRPSGAKVSLANVGFDENFVGFSLESPAVVAAPEVAAVAASSPGIVTENRGTSAEKLARFQDWIHRHVSATDVFCLDEGGAVIFDESSHGRFHFMARSLAHASRKSTASGGNVRIKIHAGAHLELIPVNALSGRLLLGAVVPEALLPEDVAAVVEALMQAVTPSSPEVLNEFCDFGGK